MTIKHFLLNLLGCQCLKIVENDPFLRLQVKAKEMFSTNKQYVKIKLMQNETNRWSIFW